MTKIEKQMIGVTVACIIGLGISVRGCSNAIQSYGGAEQLIIDTGKEIKTIAHQISEYNPELPKQSGKGE